MMLVPKPAKSLNGLACISSATVSSNRLSADAPNILSRSETFKSIDSSVLFGTFASKLLSV